MTEHEAEEVIFTPPNSTKDKLREAYDVLTLVKFDIDRALKELGMPSQAYPANIVNAINHLDLAFARIRNIL